MVLTSSLPRIRTSPEKVEVAVPSDGAPPPATKMLFKTESWREGEEEPIPRFVSTMRLPVPEGSPDGQAPEAHTHRFSSFKRTSPPCASIIKSPTESTWRCAYRALS